MTLPYGRFEIRCLPLPMAECSDVGTMRERSRSIGHACVHWRKFRIYTFMISGIPSQPDYKALVWIMKRDKLSSGIACQE